MIYLIYLIYLLILLATINFNKELIDNININAKEQRDWHIAQVMQWVIIYGSIMLLTSTYTETIVFGCFYPHLYDIGLNLRRGLKLNHRGKFDLPLWVKNILLIIGILILLG